MKKNPKTETLLAHTGRDPKSNFGVVNPPVYHTSTVIFDDYEGFRQSWLGIYPGITYGRHGSESHKMLEKAFCEIEGAARSLITCSGSAAISITMLALLNSGDHLLLPDSVYSPARNFAESELKRLGVEVTYYDPLIGAGIVRHIKKNTRLIYTESPGSLTMEIQDIPAITAVAKKAGVYTAIDNTWATPLLFKPFEHGIDVSIHSATKYIGGHSDLMMGVINCRKELYADIKRTYKNIGIVSGPDDIYLASRGIRTLGLRLKEQGAAALKIAKFLEAHPKIEATLHPALKSFPQHKIWKRDFKGSSGLFSFVLKKMLDDKGHSKFLDKMELFKLGYSWGGYESLIIPFELSKIRSATSFSHKGSAFRISIGLENVDDLIADLETALAKI